MYKWDSAIFIFMCLAYFTYYIMPSRFIHVITNGRISFPFKTKEYSSKYVYLYASQLFTHLPVVRYLGFLLSVFWILWIMSQQTLECRYLTEIVIFIFFDIYTEMGLLVHMLILFLTSWWNFIMTVPNYIPTKNAQEFPFVYVFIKT